MPIHTLDPQTALAVIDLQNGITALPVHPPASAVLQHARTLLDAFRERHLPVVLVNVKGAAPGRTEQAPRGGERAADWADLAQELDARTDDHRVTKHSWGAFTGTGLHDWLQARGVTQLVVIGIATSIGVESTARQAHELGYNVALPTDAMADLHAESHQHSIARIFPRLGETGTTAEVIAALARGHA